MNLASMKSRPQIGADDVERITLITSAAYNREFEMTAA